MGGNDSRFRVDGGKLVQAGEQIANSSIVTIVQ